MKVRTLSEIREERGEPVHGWVMVITGALPADKARADVLAQMIIENTDIFMEGFKTWSKGEMEVTGMTLRMESYETYVAEGMPNAHG